MASVITIAGEQLFAAKAQANEQLDIDTFIFANVPNQDPNAPINREEGIPTANIVYQQNVQQVGRINDNVVVYSTVLDSITGPFEFNWVGLYSSVNQKLVAINHVPTVTKTATAPGAAGNTLNRNFGIEYSGIAELTDITVDAGTWQLDFTARLSGMDLLTQQLAADMNGKDWFIADGLKVVPRTTENSFSVTPGVGYVSGLRVELKQEHILIVQSYPQFVYVDAWFSGNANSTWSPQLAFTVTNTEMDDYVDPSGAKHYVYKLAVINTANIVNDLRKTIGLAQKIDQHINNGDSSHDIIYSRSFRNIEEMKLYNKHKVGLKYSTGGTSWEVVDIECGVSLGSGLYAEVISSTVCANDFGADKSGIVKMNSALNDALDMKTRAGDKIPVSFQPGRYNIDGFTRRVQLPNTNIGQEIVTLVAPPTPATAAHQFMVPSVIFEGNGDIFLSAVNYRMENIGIKNRTLAGIPVLAGKLFTPYANGLEFGSFYGCYLGECNYHIYYDRTPTPDPEKDYILDMHFVRTCFFGARITTRYVNGYTAGYTEFQCYTSNCQNGLRLTQPGPCAVISHSKYEYINDFFLDLEIYGYANNYGITLDNVFVENCGGGNNASIAGYVGVARAIALPPMGLRTQIPNSAFCQVTWKNCHCTYTADNKPIAYVYMPSERFTVTASANTFSYLPAGGHIYSKSLTVFESPWDLNILNSNPQGATGYNIMNRLLIGDVGDQQINAPFQVSTNYSQVAWFDSPTGDTYITFAGESVGGSVGSDDTNGTYLRQGLKKILGVNDGGAGNATLIQNGGGLRFKSPNGLVRKILSIDNSGNPIWTLE